VEANEDIVDPVVETSSECRKTTSARPRAAAQAGIRVWGRVG
jgi:hypothetical protein